MGETDGSKQAFEFLFYEVIKYFTNQTKADVYVLLDSAFPSLTRIDPSQQYNSNVEMILAFACGLLRGALTSLGVNCIVNAEILQIPSCQFTIRVSPKPKFN
nr:trafficking protein particle complex subunit 6b [Hymenolepis microstoma]